MSGFNRALIFLHQPKWNREKSWENKKMIPGTQYTCRYSLCNLMDSIELKCSAGTSNVMCVDLAASKDGGYRPPDKLTKRIRWSFRMRMTRRRLTCRYRQVLR